MKRTDADRLGPAGHETRDGLTDDGLAEDSSAENVPDGPVRREPHLLQAELFHALLVGRDRGALDGHVVLEGGVRRVDRHLIVGGVAVGRTQVVVEALDVQVGEDQILLDLLPDDPGHLVTVHLHNRLGHLDTLAIGV